MRISPADHVHFPGECSALISKYIARHGGGVRGNHWYGGLQFQQGFGIVGSGYISRTSLQTPDLFLVSNLV